MRECDVDERVHSHSLSSGYPDTYSVHVSCLRPFVEGLMVESPIRVSFPYT